MYQKPRPNKALRKVEDINIMYCPKCGNELETGTRFCASCGADLNAIEQTDPIADYSEPTTPETDTYYSETEYTTPNEDDYSGVATATLPRPEEAPATPAEPELTPAPEIPENETVTTHTQKKKNKAIKPIIIAACIVAVLGVGGYVCKANFTPAVSRLIKGDQGYAISLAERSAMEFINNADPINSLTADVIPSLYTVSTDDNTYIENAITANMYAGVITQAIGEDNIAISHNVSVTPLSDYNNLTEGIDTRYKDLINSLGNYTLSASFSSNDDNKAICGSLSYNNTDILSAGLSYPRNGKDSYITLPAVTDQFVTLTLPRQGTNPDIDADELNSLYSSMLDVIKYYYKDAEITYSKGKENVGDISFNGDIVTVSFNQETISNILGDMADVISDSNLRGSLGNNSVLSQFIQFLENEQDYIYFMSETNCSLDFVTYVKSDGSIAGNKIKYRENHRNDKKSFDFLSLSEGSKYAVYAKINGVKMVDVRVDRQSSTSGNAVVSLALSDNDTAVLVVDYKDFEVKKLHNLPVLTGSYTITPYLSDNIMYALAELGFNIDTLYTLETNPTTLNLSAEDNSYKVDLTLANIAQITAETKLSEDTATVRKVGEEINSNDIVSIEDLDTKISEYVTALNDPLFALINNTPSSSETSESYDYESYEETDPETFESYYGY